MGDYRGQGHHRIAGEQDVLGQLQPRELRAQRLLSDVVEPHDKLGVVFERLNAEHRAEAELRMTDFHALTEGEAGGLILVLIRVGRGLFFYASAAAAALAVGIGAELVVRKVALVS